MSDFNTGSEEDRWNHHPGEVKLNPLYRNPFNLRAIFQWYASYWLVLSTTTFCLLMAIFMVWVWLPAGAPITIQSALLIWSALFVPQVVVAGGLHLFLYRYSVQDKP